MGELYESKQNWDKAKESYQKALEIQPDNPLASNNLAYVMLESGGNVDVALSLAQTARRGMPDSPTRPTLSDGSITRKAPINPPSICSRKL